MLDSVEFYDDGVEIIFSEIVTASDVLDSINVTVENKRFELFKYQICDFRKTEHIEITAQQISAIAKKDNDDSERNKGLKVAIITSHLMVYSLAWVYESFTMSGHYKVKIFEDYEEAKKWVRAK